MARDAFEKLSEDKKNAILKSGISEFSKKSYSDASTDEITRNCGISKGILFHYFGSKKEFYLYCLEQGLQRLLKDTPEPIAKDFYGIIFSVMDEKFSLCREFPDEMKLVNMAARERSGKVDEYKNKVLGQYLMKTKEKSAMTMVSAVEALNLKTFNNEKVTAALSMYVGVVINRYLEIYKEKPELFFEKSEEIKEEIKEYIDFMLNGVKKEDETK
jgi:AcrR family transcriptional regulator